MQEAIRIADVAEEGLFATNATIIDKALLLPEGLDRIHPVLCFTDICLGTDAIWAAPIVNPNQANSALTYFVYLGPLSDQRTRVISSLLVQIFSEPAFNILRTKEQLGYIVSCTSWSLPGSTEKGMRIVVQSERMPSYLEERVEAFLDEMKSKLETMSDEEFAEQKGGLQKKWLEADKNLNDEVSRFISHVNSGHWDFLRSKFKVLER